MQTKFYNFNIKNNIRNFDVKKYKNFNIEEISNKKKLTKVFRIF